MSGCGFFLVRNFQHSDWIRSKFRDIYRSSHWRCSRLAFLLKRDSNTCVWRTHLFWWTPPVVASLYIQAELEKTRTWKNSVFGYFSRNWWAKWYVVPLNHQPKPLCWLISTYLLTDYNLVRSQSLLHYLKMKILSTWQLHK